jgi:hypothetical protein
LARSGLLIPTQSSPDLVRSTTLEYTHPSLATPAQSTWDHAQLRTAYALHYRTLEMAAKGLRPPRGKRAPKTRLVSPSRPDIKHLVHWSPKVCKIWPSQNLHYYTYVTLAASRADSPQHSSLCCGLHFVRFLVTHLHWPGTSPQPWPDHGWLRNCSAVRLPFDGRMGFRLRNVSVF